MARIAYPDAGDAALEELVERIAAERGGLPHLYHLLLHSPPVAAGWLRYLTSVRHEASLPGDLRELVVMRVAILNDAPYEAEQHAPIALREGLTPAQLAALPEWASTELFDRRARAVLAYTDAMTRTVDVPDDVFAALRAECDERLIVELTATVAAYNMVSRFLVALQVHGDDARSAP